MRLCVRVRACVRARARVCVRMCVCARVCAFVGVGVSACGRIEENLGDGGRKILKGQRIGCPPGVMSVWVREMAFGEQKRKTRPLCYPIARTRTGTTHRGRCLRASEIQLRELVSATGPPLVLAELRTPPHPLHKVAGPCERELECAGGCADATSTYRIIWAYRTLYPTF